MVCGWLAASTSQGWPTTSSLCYMIAQLDNRTRLTRGRVPDCYSSCSHTDTTASKQASILCRPSVRGLSRSNTCIQVPFARATRAKPVHERNAPCHKASRHLSTIASNYQDHILNHHTATPALIFGGASSMNTGAAGSRRPHRRNRTPTNVQC